MWSRLAYQTDAGGVRVSTVSAKCSKLQMPFLRSFLRGCKHPNWALFSKSGSDVHKKEASLKSTHVIKSGKVGELAATIHASVSDQ